MKRLKYLLLGLFFLISCNSDDDPAPAAPKIDPGNSTAVSEGIGENNPSWVEIDGNAPASNGGLAQTSSADGQSFEAEPNGTVEIDIEVTSGDAGSIVLQIEGAINHYEVPSDPDGRLGSGSNAPFLFSFSVPKRIKDGNFCILLAVKNEGGEVSNYIRFCIDIKDPNTGGGTGNPTLPSLEGTSWNIDVIEYYDDNDQLTQRDVLGQDIVENFEVLLPCPQGGFELTPVDITRNFILLLEFNAPAFYREQADGSITLPDTADSDCENVKYLQLPFGYTTTGSWSLDASTSIITMDINSYVNDLGQFVPAETRQAEILELDLGQATGSLVVKMISWVDLDPGEYAIIRMSGG